MIRKNKYTSFFDNPSVEFLNLSNEKSNFVICGYYWGENNINKNSIKKLTYGQQIQRLINQCKQLNVNYYFARYDDFTKILYQEAISLKPLFVKKCFRDIPGKTIALFDTDLQLLQYPHLFDIDADCFFLNWSDYKTTCYNPFLLEASGGVMGFGNTHCGKVLLDILIDSVISNLQYAEDKVFSKIFTKNLLNVYTRCVWLPMSYLYMFEYHEYIPGKGYTKIVDLKTDLSLSGDKYHKEKDIVIIHEDFETGALDDVYKQKVSKNRVPSDYDKALGKKLRCPPFDFKFNFYYNYGLNNKQYNQLIPGLKYKIKYDIMTKPSRIEKIRNYLCKKDFKIISSHIKYDTNFIIATEHSEHTIKFIESCYKLKINYVIVESVNTKKNVNKALVCYYMLQKFNTKNIVYMDSSVKIKKYPTLFDNTDFDFMTFNKNDTSTLFKKCIDPRVLDTINDKVFVFSNTKISKQFLSLWNMYNTKSSLQHKNLEYIFNKSISVNKLRCLWLPKTYLKGSILKLDDKDIYQEDYSPESIKSVRQNIVQCGIRKSLKNGFEIKEHYHSSRNIKKISTKYKKKFVTF